jgi:hypothetical protein
MLNITEWDTMYKGRTHLEFVLVSADILDNIEMVFHLWFPFLRLQYGVLL